MDNYKIQHDICQLDAQMRSCKYLEGTKLYDKWEEDMKELKEKLNN